MIKKSLLVKIYEAAGMQRWNDQIRTIELTELDKQAHKMIVAYILGKCEQDMGGKIDWVKIIEDGLFEFLKRIILTDLKPPLIYRIKRDKKQYEKLNRWVFERISPYTQQVGEDFNLRFEKYLLEQEETLEKKIVDGAHFYVTKWEFDIIKSSNTRVYLIEEIVESISREQGKYNNLRCMRIFTKNKKLLDFANICGQLRFQHS